MHAPFFGLTTTHAYFSDGRCRTLSLLPTPECAHQMDRHRLLFRADAGGGTMYAHTDGPDVDANTVFAFEMRWSDSKWIHYTDLALGADGFAPRSTTFFFTSRTASDGVPQPLHTAPTVSVDDQIPVRPPVFGVPFATGLDVLDDAGEVVWSGPSPDAADASVDVQTDVQVDLRGVGPGRYHLRSDGVETDAFYRTERPASSLVGIVEVAWTDAYTRALETGDGPPVFALHFGSRSTVWRYRIDRRYRDAAFFDRHDLVYLRRPHGARGLGSPPPDASTPDANDAPEIVTFSHVRRDDASADASGDGNGSDATNEDEIVYESDRRLPLREDPTVGHTAAVGFRRRGGTNGWALRLPYAGAATLHPEDDRDVSDVYVTL